MLETILIGVGAAVASGIGIACKVKDSDISFDKNRKGSIKNWVRLIEGAQNRLNAVTDFDPYVFENGGVLSAVLDLVRKGAEIRFAYDTGFVPTSYQQLLAQRKINIARAGPLPCYFSVADGLSCRVETHEPYGDKTSLSYWGFPNYAGSLEEKFWNLDLLQPFAKV